MAIPVKFDKAHALYLLDCLSTGKPIQPKDPRGFTGDDMLALAGACYFGAMSQGPGAWAQNVEAFQSKVKEHREAVSLNFETCLLAAIEFYGVLTDLVKHEEYDARQEPKALALVGANEIVGKTFAPVRGFKGMKNLME